MMRCSICRKHVDEEFGHNALPINEGRCCSDCNMKYVLPSRISRTKPIFKIAETSSRLNERLAEREKFRLEKPQGSSVHHMEEFFAKHDGSSIIEHITDGPKLQSFVVEHDWGAVLDDDFGMFILPYPFCSFEFRISGMRCIFMLRTMDDGIANYANFIGCDDAWVPLGTCDLDIDGKIVSVNKLHNSLIEPKHLAPLYEFVFRQIRAVCVMFETSVAVKQTIRAPEKLNRQREKRGRTKLRDYHVVVLNRKPRVDTVPAEMQIHGDRNSPRLHFRRGHWRHLINHRTWINWQLVGDPDLGFIDKHYRVS